MNDLWILYLLMTVGCGCTAVGLWSLNRRVDRLEKYLSPLRQPGKPFE